MSACHCCDQPILDQLEIGKNERRQSSQISWLSLRPSLFNWITVLLVTGWVVIVAIAAELAGPDSLSAVPTLEGFLKELL